MKQIDRRINSDINYFTCDTFAKYLQQLSNKRNISYNSAISQFHVRFTLSGAVVRYIELYIHLFPVITSTYLYLYSSLRPRFLVGIGGRQLNILQVLLQGVLSTCGCWHWPSDDCSLQGWCFDYQGAKEGLYRKRYHTDDTDNLIKFWDL